MRVSCHTEVDFIPAGGPFSKWFFHPSTTLPAPRPGLKRAHLILGHFLFELRSPYGPTPPHAPLPSHFILNLREDPHLFPKVTC